MIDYSGYKKKRVTKALMATRDKRLKGKLIDSDRLDRTKDNILCSIVIIGFGVWMAWVLSGVDS